MAAGAAPLAAQQAQVDGRVLHVRERDTVPAATVVVLHGVSAARQGPLDSVRAGADGRWRFRFRVDSGTVYIVSARHDGIEYFSRPLAAARGATESASLFLHDTSSAATVKVAGRYWVVGRPTPARRRPVLDLVLLHNPGPRTRVARDSLAASWTMPLPAGAADVAAGQGEFSPASLEPRGDSLAVLAPLVPGDRQLVVQYTIPLAARVRLPYGTSGDSVVVLLEEADARVASPGFASLDTTRIEGRLYRRWAGVPRAPGGVDVRFASAASTEALAPLVAVLALALAALGVYVLRRPRPARVAPADRVSRLVEEIAGLDAAYAGREGEVDAETWQRYQADRARLRHELDAALAAGGAAR